MQYECENNGSTVYHGRTVRYKKGVCEYEPGSLDHVPSCKMIEASNDKGVTTIKPKKSSDYTIAELRDMDLSEKDDAFFEGDTRSTIDKLR